MGYLQRVGRKPDPNKGGHVFNFRIIQMEIKEWTILTRSHKDIRDGFAEVVFSGGTTLFYERADNGEWVCYRKID